MSEASSSTSTATTTDGPAKPVGRLRQLDGLRGVAAVVVMFSHLSVIVPEIAGPYFGQPRGEVGSLEWWVSHTPLKLFTLGVESVFVFFILSGLVVSLPAFANPSWSWKSFYPRRIVRLYVPTLAALLFAYALALYARNPADVGSVWLQMQAGGPSVREALRDATVVAGGFRLDNPLWSIRWEVIFSLTLPIFTIAAVIFRKIWLLPIVALAALVIAGVSFQIDLLAYPAMFALGVVMASQLARLRAVAEAISRNRFGGVVWTALLAASVVSLMLYWLVWPATSTGGEPVHLMLRGLGGVGAVVLVFVVCFWQRLTPFFTTRFVQWLGKISFSLYLVHVPILVTLAFALHALPMWLVIVMSALLSLVVAQLFFLIVERPSHKLSGVVGRRFAPRA